MSGKTILLVDDSMAVRRAVALMLGADYECLQAADGRQALGLLQENEVDLVIADLHMPVMDGFELIREMRKDRTYRFTPVLVLTTEGREEVIADLKRVGVTGVLQKPVERDSLLAAVRRALG
ncbi:MAG: response regulator [Coriobacteriia bacterium]|nr:response regulator [Coriobacteriia bacterium]